MEYDRDDIWEDDDIWGMDLLLKHGFMFIVRFETFYDALLDVELQDEHKKLTSDGWKWSRNFSSPSTYHMPFLSQVRRKK